MTSVWQSTVTEAWATVTATDNANPITGEQRVMRNEDAFMHCQVYLLKMRKKQLSTGFQIYIPRRRIQGDQLSLDPISCIPHLILHNTGGEHV